MEEITVLFAVDAEQFLISGFVEEAIDMCERGLEKYPDYTAAYSVLARAYKAAGRNDKADEALERSSVHFSDKKSFDMMKNNIDVPDFLKKNTQPKPVAEPASDIFPDETEIVSTDTNSELSVANYDADQFLSDPTGRDSADDPNNELTTFGADEYFSENDSADFSEESEIIKESTYESKSDIGDVFAGSEIETLSAANFEDLSEQLPKDSESAESYDDSINEFAEEDIAGDDTDLPVYFDSKITSDHMSMIDGAIASLEESAIEEGIESEFMNDEGELIPDNAVADSEFSASSDMFYSVDDEAHFGEDLTAEIPTEPIDSVDLYKDQEETASDTEVMTNDASEYAVNAAPEAFKDVLGDEAIVIAPSDSDDLPGELTGEIETDDVDTVTEIISDEVHEPKTEYFMRLVKESSAHIGTSFSLKSDDPSLIPGLEFSPLKTAHRTIKHPEIYRDPELPDFVLPGYSAKSSVTIPDYGSTDQNTEGKPLDLEALAKTLETAVIPRVEEPDAIDEEADDDQNDFGGETLAMIYEQQGAYREALDAYRRLLVAKPENASLYIQKIELIEEYLDKNKSR